MTWQLHSTRLRHTITPGAAQRMQFSLKTVLLVVSVVAVACSFFMQQRRLNESQSALSRYEASQIPTSLAPGQFRVIARSILDTDHVKVVAYRIESANEHFATVKSEGDSNGCKSKYDPKTHLHWTEATILFDHIKSDNKVKMMPKVGGAQGYTLAHVPDGYSLTDAVKLNELDRLFSRRDCRTV